MGKKAPAFLKHKGTAKVEKIHGEGKERGVTVSYEDGRREVVVRPEPVKASLRIDG